MLYDTVGPAVLATLEPGQLQSTHDLKVSFLRPVRPGRILANGRVVQRHADMAFIEASLTRADHATTATANARIIPYAQAPTAV